jgi:NAD(P)-dependent dehydrogenase (short-subunit alcohol dehydrogenase family)
MSYRNMFDLNNKTALVVGGASGIGAAVAQGLADFGASVVVADQNIAGCEQLSHDITASGGVATPLFINLTDASSVAEALGSIPKLDILVATPAINVRKPILNTSDEEFARVLELNLLGNFRLLREAGRKMQASGGSIIAFSSIRSLTVEPGQGVYAATKAGLLQFVRTLAVELAPHGVRANVIGPGVINTPLTAPIKSHPAWYEAYAKRSALGRWGEPKELVGAVVYLASPAASFVTGTIHFVDGGWTAIDGRFDPPL